MRIAVLGAGAMGSLFGGYLSQHNDVWLIDVDKEKIDCINANGVKIKESDKDVTMFPKAATNSKFLNTVDLVIVFVKSMYTRAALQGNRSLIGENTYLMSLQNGLGHEEFLSEFVPMERVVIGITQHNSSIIAPGYIQHGGGGQTHIGLIQGDSGKLQFIADAFNECGISTIVSENIRKQSWNKLLLNASASVLTGILQVKLGFIAQNPHAWRLAEQLVNEAIMVAKADGIDLDPQESISTIRKVLEGASEGYTSIYADLKKGVRSEVDTISGSIVKAANRLGIKAPVHEFVVDLVHSIEERPAN